MELRSSQGLRKLGLGERERNLYLFLQAAVPLEDFTPRQDDEGGEETSSGEKDFKGNPNPTRRENETATTQKVQAKGTNVSAMRSVYTYKFTPRDLENLSDWGFEDAIPQGDRTWGVGAKAVKAIDSGYGESSGFPGAHGSLLVPEGTSEEDQRSKQGSEDGNSSACADEAHDSEDDIKAILGSALTASQLRDRLRTLGLPSFGTQAELHNRLSLALEEKERISKLDEARARLLGVGAKGTKGSSSGLAVCEERKLFDEKSQYGSSQAFGGAPRGTGVLRDNGVRWLRLASGELEVVTGADEHVAAALSRRGPPVRPPENSMPELARRRIGEWGEAFVYDCLKAQTNAKVTWVNEEQETGCPYDIVIQDVTGKKTYVEVKTTVSSRQTLFTISWSELLFAAEHSRQYQIYRVSSAPRDPDRDCPPPPGVRLLRIENPVQRLVDRNAKLYYDLE